jgi:hypothetical protein
MVWMEAAGTPSIFVIPAKAGIHFGLSQQSLGFPLSRE